jgi:hypothetical protein
VKPHVSVIMSVHNGGSYLSEAVESLLRQTYHDFEFLIVDDGSTDGSGEYLDSVAAQDPRVRILKQENRGLVASLNRLIKESRGSLLARMDADDICLPQRLQAQVERFQSDPTLGVLGGKVELIDTQGRCAGKWHYPLTAEASVDMLQFGCPVAHPAVMMRRDLVVEVGGYRSFFAHCEDYDLWLRMSERAYIANLDQVVLRYRIHEDSISSLNKTLQLTGTFLAQAAWLMRKAGQPDPVAQWDEISEQTLKAVELPPEEKCLLLARWTSTVIWNLGPKDAPRAEEYLENFPTILPAVGQQGRRIRIRLHKELTLRAWIRRDIRQTIRHGLILIRHLIPYYSRSLVSEMRTRLSE